jgi:dTDP-4-dehydrorhamnose reductase
MTRVLLLGATGKIGHGIKLAVDLHGSFEVFAPNKNILNLHHKAELNNYIENLNPNTIIYSSGYTSVDEKNKPDYFKSNISLLSNLAEASGNVETLIHISSASIYESFPINNLFEKEFTNIAKYPPKSQYAKLKAFESKIIVEKQNSKNSWYSLILPHTIHSNKKYFLKSDSLFNELSALIYSEDNSISGFFKFSNMDSVVPRQFIHSEDVGNFCIKLMKEDFEPGIVHLPNLPKINIWDFCNKHFDILGKKNPMIKVDEGFKLKYLESSNFNIIDFNYDFPSAKIADKLLQFYTS